MLTKVTLFGIFALLLSAFHEVAARPQHKSSRKMTLFAAGYHGTIIPYSVDGKSGDIAQISNGVKANSSGTEPSWIAFSPSPAHKHGDSLYSVASLYSVDEVTPGRIFSHTYDPSSKQIVHTGKDEAARTNGSSSGGDGPVSCLVGHGPSKGMLFVANYMSGSAAVLKVDAKDGTLSSKPEKVFQFQRPANQPKIGPVADRQDHSYAHQVAITPSGKWVYVCDLGADQIHHLRIKDGNVEFTDSTDVKIGSGPRHVTFYRDAESHKVFGYLASELDNTVSAYAVDEDTGKLTLLQEPILASPPGVPLSGPGILPTNRTTAEIAVAPQGDFVYVSDRGDEVEDHISVFKRDRETGKIKFQEWVGSGGRMPRHFSLSSDSGKDGEAKWLAVGHQTDENIVVFKRGAKTGSLQKAHVVDNAGPVAFSGFSPF